MGGIRVLLANEPRAYREAMAAAIRRLRPGAEVVEVDPDDLDGEVDHLRPHLVLSSRPAGCLEDGGVPHVLIYPAGEPGAMVAIDGHRETVAGVELEDLLSVVDRVAHLAQCR